MRGLWNSLLLEEGMETAKRPRRAKTYCFLLGHRGGTIACWGLSPVINDTNTAHEFVSMAWGSHVGDLRKSGHRTLPHRPYSASTSRILAGSQISLALKKAAAKHGLKLGSPAANRCKPQGTGSQPRTAKYRLKHGLTASLHWMDDIVE